MISMISEYLALKDVEEIVCDLIYGTIPAYFSTRVAAPKFLPCID
jgi:hypothetical protein